MIHARLNQLAEKRLKELEDKLSVNESEAIRISISIAHGAIFEKDKYLVNFYDLRESKLHEWLTEQDNKTRSKN